MDGWYNCEGLYDGFVDATDGPTTIFLSFTILVQLRRLCDWDPLCFGMPFIAWFYAILIQSSADDDDDCMVKSDKDVYLPMINDMA
jgi:hypothetical protein